MMEKLCGHGHGRYRLHQSLRLCSEQQTQRETFRINQNQRVFTASTVISYYYGIPLLYNGILMPTIHQHLPIRSAIDEIINL